MLHSMHFLQTQLVIIMFKYNEQHLSLLWYHFIDNAPAIPNDTGGRSGRGRLVVWFTTTYAISTYHH
jgi:hypothetical protein